MDIFVSLFAADISIWRLRSPLLVHRPRHSVQQRSRRRHIGLWSRAVLSTARHHGSTRSVCAVTFYISTL